MKRKSNKKGPEHPPEKSACFTSSSSTNYHLTSTPVTRSRASYLSGQKRKICSDERMSTKKSNKASDPAPEIMRRIFNGKPGDSFCWLCHKLTDEVLCPNCPRTYHIKCFKKIKFNLSEPVCVCSWTSIDGPNYQPNISGSLKELLPNVICQVSNEKNNKKQRDVANDYCKLKALPQEWSEKEFICNIVDIAFIIDKIKLNKYKNTSQFFLDVQTIHHNFVIVEGSDHILTTIAENFEKAVKMQLSDLEACEECYKRKSIQYPSSDFFANVCSPPHDIIWAKLKGFPFWPAKCLRIINGHADVRFFGTHDKSLVPLHQVYKISRENPGRNPKKHHNSSRITPYEESMVELSVYIENFENEYGTGKFQYYSQKTPLQSVKLLKKKKRDTSETKARSRLHSSKAAMNSSVLCHMRSNEEHPSEMNATENVVKEISDALHIAPLQLSCQVSDNSIGNVHPTISTITESNQTSSAYSCAGPSTFAGPSMSDRPSTSAEPSISTPVITSTESLSDSLPSPPFDFTQTINEIQSIVDDLLPDNNEEIQLIAEVDGGSVVENVFDTQAIVKALCELLFSNKPNVRNYVQSFQNMGLCFYLKMWLDANSTRFNSNEFKMFFNYCDKLCKAIEVLKSRNGQLKSEAEILKTQNDQLKSEVEDLKCKLAAEKQKIEIIARRPLREEIIKKQTIKNDEDIQKLKKQWNSFFSTLNATKNSEKHFQEMAKNYRLQFEQLKVKYESLKLDLVKVEEEKLLQLGYEKQLKDALKEKEIALEKQKLNPDEKDNVIKRFMEKIKSLEEKNRSLTEESLLETGFAHETDQDTLTENINILNQNDEISSSSSDQDMLTESSDSSFAEC